MDREIHSCTEIIIFPKIVILYYPYNKLVRIIKLKRKNFKREEKIGFENLEKLIRAISKTEILKYRAYNS